MATKTQFKERQDLLFQVLTRPSGRDAQLVPAHAPLPTPLLPYAQVAARTGLPVRFLGTMPLFSGYRVYPARERDWVLVNLGQDPLYSDRDGFPMSDQALEDLKRIRQAQWDPVIYVAHEVSKGSVREGEPDTLRALLPSGPQSLREDSERWGQRSGQLWRIASAPLRLSRYIAGAVAAAGSAAAIAGMALATAGLDPIVLGVLTMPGKPPAPNCTGYWFYLTHWDYGHE